MDVNLADLLGNLFSGMPVGKRVSSFINTTLKLLLLAVALIYITGMLLGL